MNLSEALDAALPEIPKARLARSRPPQIDPNLITREDILDGERIIAIFKRGKGDFYRFPPEQWALAQLFDGVRTYEEVAQAYTEQSGTFVTAEEVKIFAETLDESDFWLRTAQEKNLAMSARLTAQRSRRAQRTSKINFAHISFSAWDPDVYLTWLDKLVGRFIYSPWSVLAVVCLFAFEATVFIGKWNVLGPDIPLYFNFTHKSFADFAEFWILLFVLGFIHESAHGLTCKHFGGEVHSMGLMLLYMTPAFFVDVTESWVSATKIQRLYTIIAGIWIEMVICGLAMLVWTNTQPGLWIHDLSYKVILITGLAVIVLNLNPLLKLDGYYFLTEIIGIPELKERSTAFVSGWFQRRILCLPVEIPSIARRRAPFFILYALASGAYSYLMLFAFIRFSYNLTSKLLAEFALIPVGMLAFAMFRSRLKSLASVSKEFWKQRKANSRLLHPLPILITLALLALIFMPIFRDRENAFFVIDPAETETLHSAIAGKVESVLVREGETVRAGQPLLRMTSADAASMASESEAALNRASYQSVEAQLRGQSIGTAASDRQAALQSKRLAQDAHSHLTVKASTDGMILTADPASLAGQLVGSGQSLITVARTGPKFARVFVPASALDRVSVGSEIALELPGQFNPIHLQLAPMQGSATDLPPGLIAHQDYKGIALPTFYIARMMLPASAQNAAIGSGGAAKIFGRRRSFFQRALTVLIDLCKAHLW